MSNRLMAHMVAYYPDRDSSIEIAKALVDGGASYLEIQFPFSDPTADGIYIQEACSRALQEGFKVASGFELLLKIKGFAKIPVFIMGYANLVFFHGVENFLKRCLYSGARGIIIPDLPPGYDEGIFSLGKSMDLYVVPVIAPTIRVERLNGILSLKPEFIYATLRKGITGAYTTIGEESISFLERIGSQGAKILAGFGISEKKQIEAISEHVHATVVGSAFIKEIRANRDRNPYPIVLKKMKELTSQ